MKKSKKNTRAVAARCIQEVMNGKSLTEVLDDQLILLSDERDRALVQNICYGVCRFFPRLTWIATQRLKKQLRDEDKDIYALLLVGIYQLLFLRIPEYAAVADTVNAVYEFNKSWAAGLVNAILRAVLREQKQISAAIKSNPEAFYAHPAWLLAAIKASWPEHWEEILNANNQQAPLSLRVSQSRVTRDAYLAKLGGEAKVITETQSGLILETPQAVEELPGFAEGEVSVQDGGAQLAAELLDLSAQQRVLDACAAPGGKLTHILELEPNLSACIAIEKDSTRMQTVKANLVRLQQQATGMVADAAKVDSWWDGVAFDRILIDAPCSGSGVIRRHPDIKLLRRAKDIPNMAREQSRLLNALWPTLKAGGMLLYVTCSIFPEENAKVIEKFLKDHADAREEKISADWGIACSIGRQILPGMHQMDGFYYAKLRKK